MSSVAIRVENLSKRYRIGAKEEGYRTIRESIVDSIKAPFKNIKTLRKLTRFDNNSNSNNEDDTIWALKDVSFNVKEGEVIGIIGRNGAGKSTLLKILSRITEPTSGFAEIHGRVSSLLEVGTGFHPELTGRENIYLNGTILGMRKKEIKRKFDEIVTFAEIKKFLDTPVKRYSSGMYVRLAFAVAAHLEPEILIVDEVLSVGDASFQKKCLGKMGDVAKEGRTVLFVSHNMGAINTLCSRCFVLESGKLTYDGLTQNSINYYLSPLQGKNNTDYVSFEPDSSFPAQILKVSLHGKNGGTTNTFLYEDGFEMRIILQVKKPSKSYYANFCIYNAKGEGILFSSDDDLRESFLATMEEGLCQYRIKIPGKILKPDNYSISFAIAPRIDHDHDLALYFEIKDLSSRRASRTGGYRNFAIAPELNWKAEVIESF